MDESRSTVALDTLDPAQTLAVVSPASRLCIVASAGSGKTRVITKRIEYLCSQGLSPRNVVAITFTRKAGFELAQRLSHAFGPYERERPYVGTLHSFALNELRSLAQDERTTMKNIVENSTTILTKLKVDRPHNIARVISWCKSRMMSPEHITEDSLGIIARNCHLAPRALRVDTIKDAWKAYSAYCSSHRLMDHDDVLLEYARRLHDATYAASRHFLYRHICVDEFQDTTPVHMEIYSRLVGDTGSITVVGDPDQSIFSFAGSSDTYLNNFTDFFPGAEIVFLSTNYRSTRANVEVSRSVIENQSHHSHVEAERASTILPEVHMFSDEHSEAQGTMEIISHAHARGVPLHEIAVLVRTNAQKENFISAARTLGIPVTLGRSPEKDPRVARILSTLSSILKKRRWKSIYDALDDIDRVGDLLHDSATETHESDEEESQSEILARLRKNAHEYINLFPHDTFGDVTGFFEYITDRLDGSAQTRHGFHLLSFHQSKGLEFTTVIVTGLEKGLVPLYQDKVRKREEARLAYVAMSRASEELHVTRACVRRKNDRVLITEPSEFLEPIGRNISDIDLRNDMFSPQEAIKRIADIRAKHLIKKPSSHS